MYLHVRAGESHPGPMHEDGTYVGRSAPEIDIIEGQMSNSLVRRCYERAGIVELSVGGKYCFFLVMRAVAMLFGGSSVLMYLYFLCSLAFQRVL